VNIWDQVLRSLVDEARNLPAILSALSNSDAKALTRDVDFLQLDRTSARGRRLGAHVLRVAIEQVFERIRSADTSSEHILLALTMFERTLELFPQSIDECVGRVYMPQHGSVAKTKKVCIYVSTGVRLPELGFMMMLSTCGLIYVNYILTFIR
jgi:hypothetical protein